MKKKLLILIILLFSGKAYTQTISGLVTDAVSALPLQGVSVEVPQSTIATTTDASGSFSLQVSGFPVTLRFTAPGYESRDLRYEEPAQGQMVLLSQRGEALSEVILRSTVIPKELRQTPAAVSLLSAADLDRFDQTSLLQAVTTVPGVYVHQGALNTHKLSIRGIGSRSQYSTNRVKAYFEEIPLSTAEGETTLDDIDPSVIGRTEIIKGPNSSVYGAGLGGVINLYAAAPEVMGTQAGVRTAFGSFGMLKNTVQASHASENTQLMAAYNHLETDSFRENGAYERDSFTLHGRVSGDEDGTLSVLAQFTRLMAYIPSSLNREQLEEEPSSAAFTWNAARGYESYDKGLLGLSYRHSFSEDFYNTTSVFTHFRNGYEPRPFDILKEEQVAMGTRTKFNLKSEFLGMQSEYSMGAEILREWYDTALFENLYRDHPGEGSVAGDNTGNNSQDRSYYNFFGQWNLSLSERLGLEAGLNVNTTRYELTDLYTRDEIDQSGAYTFGTVYSPRLGMVYDVSLNKSFYASISHGFSTPAVAETLTPEGLINTSLKPETGINYEAGFKGNWLNNRLYTEVAVYSIQVEDLLVAERVAEDQYIGRNIGKTDHNGLEFLVSYRTDLSPSIALKTFLNGSLNFFEFDEFTERGVDYSGNELPGVPERTFNAGLDLVFLNDLSLNATWQHVGEMPLDDANTGYNEGYNLLHIKAAYELRLGEHWRTEFFGGLNNVLDEAYASAIVPNAVGFGGAAPRYFYPGNPRNYFAGVNLNYRF